MLSSFPGCKALIPRERLAKHSKSGGGGREEDNKATGEGRKAMEIVSGVAEWWVKRHEKGGEESKHRERGRRNESVQEEVRTVLCLGMLAGKEKPDCPLPTVSNNFSCSAHTVVVHIILNCMILSC